MGIHSKESDQIKTSKMSLAGSWKKSRSENGGPFFTAFGIPEEQLKRAQAATITTTIEDNGASAKLTRVYIEADGNVKTDVNECTFGVETELTGPRGNPYKATVTKESAAKWTIKGAGGEVTGTIEMDGAEMLETLTGKGQTFKRWS